MKTLARAPVGCTTTLVFDKAATFTIYIETKGKVGDLSGDCEANGAAYQHAGDKLPKVSMTLVDSSDAEIDLQRGSTASYDVGGYVGTGSRTVTITEPGTYRLNVESDDSDFAVAIGKDPKADSELLKTVGGAVALGGLVLGLTSCPARSAPAPSGSPGDDDSQPGGTAARLAPWAVCHGTTDGAAPARPAYRRPRGTTADPAAGATADAIARPTRHRVRPSPRWHRRHSGRNRRCQRRPARPRRRACRRHRQPSPPTVPPPAPDDGDDEGWAKPDD